MHRVRDTVEGKIFCCVYVYYAPMPYSTHNFMLLPLQRKTQYTRQ